MHVSDQTLTQDILAQFFPLCTIPRPSGGEAAAAAYLAGQLTAGGLSPETDALHNLRCLLPAAPGWERVPGVILQAHTDMVCVAAPGGGYRPGTDPVIPVTDGGWLRSDGRSSLGADNGIGVALMLWLAQQRQLPHGPVLLLFTACEERGLVGAKGVDPRWLEGFDFYINLDAFRGDAAIFASAGGLRQSWSRGVGQSKCTKPFAFTVTLSGLTGGHSGFDIHRGRQNALRLLTDLVSQFSSLDLCALSGGSDYNAIPTRAQAVAAVEDPDGFSRCVQRCETLLRQSCQATDPGLTVTLTPCAVPEYCWDRETQRDVTCFLSRLPAGPKSMRTDCPGTVADSGNPAVLAQEGDRVLIRHFSRCATRASLERFREATAQTAREFHFTLVEASGYSPWEGRADSPLIQRAKAIYRGSTGTELQTAALHVGLESSLLLEKAPRLTGMALGCDILDAHSVSERVRLDSIPLLARLVTEILTNLREEC